MQSGLIPFTSFDGDGSSILCQLVPGVGESAAEFELAPGVEMEGVELGNVGSKDKGSVRRALGDLSLRLLDGISIGMSGSAGLRVDAARSRLGNEEGEVGRLRVQAEAGDEGLQIGFVGVGHEFEDRIAGPLCPESSRKLSAFQTVGELVHRLR